LRDRRAADIVDSNWLAHSIVAGIFTGALAMLALVQDEGCAGTRADA
jgi:hypothetical protein